jgi:hypothetical protein
MTQIVDRTIAILRTNANRWAELAEGVDADLLARSPAPGEWSALECLVHATDTEAPVFTTRVRALLAGEPRLASFDPDAEGTPIDKTTDPATLLTRHAAARAESLALLEQVTEADLDRTSVHAELGVVSLRELLNEWAAHDMMHIVQAERAIMQPFIAASGPWRAYFADHDVEVATRS